MVPDKPCRTRPPDVAIGRHGQGANAGIKLPLRRRGFRCATDGRPRQHHQPQPGIPHGVGGRWGFVPDEGAHDGLHFAHVFAFVEEGGVSVALHRHQFSAALIVGGEAVKRPAHVVAFDAPQSAQFGGKTAIEHHFLIRRGVAHLGCHERAGRRTGHVVFEHFVPLAQPGLHRKLLVACVRLAVNEKTLLHVVVVPAFHSGQLAINPQKVVGLFGPSGIARDGELKPCSLAQFVADHLIFTQANQPRVAIHLNPMECTQQLRAARIQSCCQACRFAGFADDVQLFTGVLFLENLDFRGLGIHAIRQLEDNDVAVRFPKPVKRLRLEVHEVEPRLVLRQDRKGLVKNRPQRVAHSSAPHRFIAHDDNFTRCADFPRQG